MPHYHLCVKCRKKYPCKRKFKNEDDEYTCKLGRKSICDKCLKKIDPLTLV